MKFHIRTRLIESFRTIFWTWWCGAEKLHFTPVHTLRQLKRDEALIPPFRRVGEFRSGVRLGNCTQVSRPFQCICMCDKKFNGLAPRRFRDRWKDRLNVAGVKDSGSHGVFTILYVGVYTEADRNAVLDSRDNKLSNGTQYAGFRSREL